MDEHPIPDEWRIPDDLWEAIAPLLPKHKNTHRHGGGRPRKSDGMPGGHPLRLTHRLPVEGAGRHPLLPGSTAHDRFQEWVEAGVFLTLWEHGLMAYDDWKGIDWDWLSMDGCMTKRPSGGKRRAKTPPTGPRRARNAACWSRRRDPGGPGGGGREPAGHEVVEETLESIPIERPAPTAEDPQGAMPGLGLRL